MTKITLILFSLAIVGCTTGQGLGEKEEVWYNDQTSVLGIFTWSEVYYCQSRKDTNGIAKPICLEAEFGSRRHKHGLFEK